MKEAMITQEQPKMQEQIKIGGTLLIVSHIFAGKRELQAAWLSIIARAENLKTV